MSDMKRLIMLSSIYENTNMEPVKVAIIKLIGKILRRSYGI